MGLTDERIVLFARLLRKNIHGHCVELA
jgi:hypothetical protein